MPPSTRHILPAIAYFIVGLASVTISRPATTQVPPSGSFTATQDCPATQAIRGANPSNVKLTVGTIYDAVGFNSTQRQYILLRIPGANPERRWVAATCGTFSEGIAPPTPDTPGSPVDGGVRRGNIILYSFFNDVDDPVPVNFPAGARKDMSPPAPRLEPFDYKIMALCGANFNDPVSPSEFRRLMTYYPDVVRRLRQVTGNEIRPGRRQEVQFLDDLTDIWFKHKGFKHIFCGEKDGNSIGGLHFHGRYVEFQEKGIAGRIARLSNGRDAKEEVVDGVIYSFGVAVMQGDRLVAEHPIKGYAYVLNAQEMLLHITRAFKLFQTDSKESVACLYTVNDPDADPFLAVFVKKEGAIRTFYPDATPDTAGTKPCDRTGGMTR